MLPTKIYLYFNPTWKFLFCTNVQFYGALH